MRESARLKPFKIARRPRAWPAHPLGRPRVLGCTVRRSLSRAVPLPSLYCRTRRKIISRFSISMASPDQPRDTTSLMCTHWQAAAGNAGPAWPGIVTGRCHGYRPGARSERRNFIEVTLNLDTATEPPAGIFRKAAAAPQRYPSHWQWFNGSVPTPPRPGGASHGSVSGPGLQRRRRHSSGPYHSPASIRTS